MGHPVPEWKPASGSRLEPADKAQFQNNGELREPAGYLRIVCWKQTHCYSSPISMVREEYGRVTICSAASADSLRSRRSKIVQNLKAQRAHRLRRGRR